MRLKEESTAHVLEYHVTTGTAGEVDDHRQPEKKKRPRGGSPRGRCYLVRITYFFSSPIAALALSAASEEFPALHAASASLTRVEAFVNSAERGAWIS